MLTEDSRCLNDDLTISAAWIEQRVSAVSCGDDQHSEKHHRHTAENKSEARQDYRTAAKRKFQPVDEYELPY